MPQNNDPGAATVTQIARHWSVTSPTARKLLKSSGIAAISTRPERYRWRDIWRLEGVGHVPPSAETEFRRPLLTPADVRRFVPHLKLRSIRDRALKGTLPAIRLGTDWRFRECDILKAMIHG